ncbi:T9SS type A sorting domain-containing protein, partial [Rurimicrobium arvi]|uniref:T9SS type A sorting domain-containing protein n=1 Tax=Rurimicrobium arvi TaxID=2049916 RepID=UPI0031DC766E
PVPVISRIGDTLSTTLSYPFYQWIRNGVDIPGANSRTYVMSLKGMYKVRVTGTNNCDGESTPVEAMDSWLSIDNSSVASSEIRVFPNPTSGKVTIESPMAVQVQVKDLSGRVIIRSRDTKEVDLGKLADGVYMFVILDKDGVQQIAQQRVTKMSNK